MFARVSAGFEWIARTICGEIGSDKWCTKNDDGDDCFDLKDEDPNHIVSVRRQNQIYEIMDSYTQSEFLLTLTYTSIA